jgi:hypothetical protein
MLRLSIGDLVEYPTHLLEGDAQLERPKCCAGGGVELADKSDRNIDESIMIFSEPTQRLELPATKIVVIATEISDIAAGVVEAGIDKD